MPNASHWLRYSLFALILAAVAFGVALSHSASPASAVGPHNIYVKNNAYTGATCVAHLVTYDHCYNTISLAIANGTTFDGDKIWVDDGTYAETPVIIKQLAVVSLNGPAVTTITGAGSVVSIAADKVTFGGTGVANGSGFTVVETSGAAGSSAVSVAGNLITGNTVIIQNNVYQGTSTIYGILVSPNIEGGHLIIQGNTFEDSPAAPPWSFQTFIEFASTPYGVPISDSLAGLSANIDILNNTGTDFGLKGVNFAGSLFFSTVNMDLNTFTDSTTPISTTFGIYIDGDIRTFSSVSITHTKINNADYGLSGSYITNHSSLTLGHFTADQFTTNGVGLSGINNQSALSIVDSHLNGNGTANDGVYIGSTVDSGSMFIVSNTTIKDFTANGINLIDTLQNGSTMLVQDATINGASGGASYGINLTQGVQSATLIINGSPSTPITNFATAGIYVQDQTQGSNVTIDGTTLTAQSSGAQFCLHFEFGPNLGSQGAVTNNICRGFGGSATTPTAGLWVDSGNGTYFNSSWLIDNNTFQAHDSGGQYGIHPNYATTSSHVSVTNNKVDKVTSDGIVMNGVEENSSANLDGNTVTALPGSSASDGITPDDVLDNSNVTTNGNIISGFESAGITYSTVHHDSTLDISRNSITAPIGGMEYGIHIDNIDFGSHVTVNANNPVTGFGGINASIGGGYGFYVDYVDHSSSLGVDGNTLTAHPDGAQEGIYLDGGTYHSSDTTITDNTVSGFLDKGLNLNEAGDDSTVTANGNTLTGKGGGATYAIYIDDIYSNSHVVANDNKAFFIGYDDFIFGPTGDEVYVNELTGGSSLNMDHNTFSGNEAYRGFYISDTFDQGSLLNLTNNTFSGYEHAGFFSSPNIDSSQLLLSDNVFAAQDCTPDAVPTLPFTTPYGCVVGPAGSQYGFRIPSAEFGTAVDLERNVFTGFGGENGTSPFSGYGLYADYGVNDGGTFKAISNKFLGVQGPGADAPNNGIYFDSALVSSGGDAYIQDNTVTGFDYKGIDPFTVDNGNATISHNTVTADPFGAEFGIYMVDVLNGSNVTINDQNIISNIGGLNASTGYPAYMNTVSASNLTWDNNTFTAAPGGSYYCADVVSPLDSGAKLAFTNNHCSGETNYGFFQDSAAGDSVIQGSVLRVDGNTFNGDTATGVLVNGQVNTGGSAFIDGNTVTGFIANAIFVDSIRDGGTLTINDNPLTGDSTGGSAGIHVDGGATHGATLEINRNTISNIASNGTGISNYEVWGGSNGTICNNNISGIGGVGPIDTGIYLEFLSGDGSSLNVCNNPITGYTNTGIYNGSDSHTNGENTISGNNLSADASGAIEGIHLAGLHDGEVTNIDSNAISNVDNSAGIYVSDTLTGSDTTIHNNVIHLNEASYGVEVGGGSVGDGSTFNVTQNEIKGYSNTGIVLFYPTWGSRALVQNNILVGGGANEGVSFSAAIEFGSIANVLNNCISQSTYGIGISDLKTTAQLHMNQNDLASPPNAISGPTTLQADGENNWYGNASGPFNNPGNLTGTGSIVTGNVDFTPWLTSNTVTCSGATATPTPSPTLIPTAVCGTSVATGSASPSASPSLTPSPTGSGITARPTRTPGPTPTPSATGSPTNTASPTATASPTGTATPTGSASPTGTATASPSPTGTAVCSATPTASPTTTGTPTSSPTASPTLSPSPSPSPTVSPPGNTETPRPTRTPTP